MKPTVERRISSFLRLGITGSEESLDGPLFAINWFDTRLAPVYHLYNALAVRSVLRIGARPLFKAEVTETIAGEAELARRFLLIVRYPRAEGLLRLLAGRLFQLVSLLRILSVKRFSFVLHKRVDAAAEAPMPELAEGKAYAIHHFDSALSLAAELRSLRALMKPSGPSILFASELAAQLVSRTRAGDWEPIPFITRKLILIQAPEPGELSSFMRGPYAAFSDRTESSYIGLLRRSL